MAPPSTQLGNLLRLTPLHQSDLPFHPSLPSSSPRPALLPFIFTLLSQGTAFLSKTTFPAHFTPHFTKTSKDATENVPVQVHKLDVPASALASIVWDGSDDGVKRSAPTGNLATEHWFTRHSRHPNLPSTSSDEASKAGAASWSEFIFGLRDLHSQHEEDFTPTLYATKVLIDWKDELASLEPEGKLVDPATGQTYTQVTFYAVEMCHVVPAPLQPRCFSVLVCTASLSGVDFVAVSIPVELGELGYYAAGKNVGVEKDGQRKKQVVVGAYAAVERVYLEKDEDGKEIIDWTMGTASDAKGNLPMFAQKMALPGAVVKDVGFFLRWIRTVPNSEKENIVIV